MSLSIDITVSVSLVALFHCRLTDGLTAQLLCTAILTIYPILLSCYAVCVFQRKSKCSTFYPCHLKSGWWWWKAAAVGVIIVDPSSLFLFQLQMSLCPWRRWRMLYWRTFSKAISAGLGQSSVPMTLLKYALDSRSLSWSMWWDDTHTRTNRLTSVCNSY